MAGERGALGLEPEVHARILVAFDALENSEDKHSGRNTGQRRQRSLVQTKPQTLDPEHSP